ncbi:MAG: SUMF1/EgtB/PvdO family nonheme iron enzyme [Myxococcota bacterium]|nr:SUMF1/EgtB/PvdO family nonheme iron enzyme [Myxococcota bacterium]
MPKCFAVWTLSSLLACAQVPLAQRDAPVFAGLSVNIPAGVFTMGSPEGEPDEAPTRQVDIPAFEIDRYEVSNAAYDLCVSAGLCRARLFAERNELSDLRQPAVGMSWYDASRYCKWVGKRLPSEAEWERAARGTSAQAFAWGSVEAVERANLRGDVDGYLFSAPVDSLSAGASPEGALHLVGNVAEWVADFYDPTVYKRMVAGDPPRPRTGRSRVVRGGSYHDVLYSARGSARDRRDPGSRWDTVGFRCAR